MTEFSGLWTTSGTPTGDQQASYTQAQLSTAFEILAACSKFEGVAPTYLNELAGSDGGANTCNIATGGAMVDGKYYHNSATVPVTIPSAVGGGNTRIDRVVLRASWSGFTVRITRIAGTDAASPTAPAITQTSGTTYDIMICQALVDTSGNITVTDERVWAMPDVDNSTIENSTGTLRVKDSGIVAAKIGTGAVTEAKIGTGAVTNTKIGAGAVQATQIQSSAVTETKIGTGAVTITKLGADCVDGTKIADDAIDSEHYVDGSIDLAHLAADCVNGTKIVDDSIDSEHYVDGSIDLAHLSADCVDDTKVGNRVPQFYRRQGNSATNWGQAGGTTTYTPTTVRMQAGCYRWTGSASSGNFTITFPTAFSYNPLVMLTCSLSPADRKICISHTGAGVSGFTAYWVHPDATTQTLLEFEWLAIGPE